MRDYGSEISALAAQLMVVMRDARKEIDEMKPKTDATPTTGAWMPIIDPNYQNLIGMSAEQKLEVYKQQLAGQNETSLSDLCDKSMRPDYQKEGCE